MAIEKLQNPWSRFGATSHIALPSQPIYQINEANRLAWQGCLAGSSKTAPRFLKISIVMGADYWSELIFMPTWVLAFYAHNDFRLDRVVPKLQEYARIDLQSLKFWILKLFVVKSIPI